MSYQFTLDEMFQLETMANDAIFANRKRLQHAQGKIDLNIKGADASILELTEEECRDALKRSIEMYVNINDVRCQMEVDGL